MSAGNSGQIAYWNGPIGKVWAKEQEKRDRDHAPLTKALLEWNRSRCRVPVRRRPVRPIRVALW